MQASQARSAFLLMHSLSQACFSSSANERRRLQQAHAAARTAEAERMKQAQAAANSLRRGGSEDAVVHLASGGGGALEVDVEFEVETRTQKLRRELQDVTRKFEREAAEYRLSHAQAIRKISEMNTVHAQEQQQFQQRVLELQDSCAKAQSQQEHFEKEVPHAEMRSFAHCKHLIDFTGAQPEALSERISHKLWPRNAGYEEGGGGASEYRLRDQVQDARGQAAACRGSAQG